MEKTIFDSMFKHVMQHLQTAKESWRAISQQEVPRVESFLLNGDWSGEKVNLLNKLENQHNGTDYLQTKISLFDLVNHTCSEEPLGSRASIGLSFIAFCNENISEELHTDPL